jgi:hypothetical protein
MRMNQALGQELLALVEEDQSFLGSPEHDWSSDRVQRRLLALLGRLRRRLVEILDSYGWPGRSLVGEGGAAAAWTLALHTMPDPDVLRRCLRLLRDAAAAGEAAVAGRVPGGPGVAGPAERPGVRDHDLSAGRWEVRPALAGGSRSRGCPPSGCRASSARARHPQDRTVSQWHLARLGLLPVSCCCGTGPAAVLYKGCSVWSPGRGGAPWQVPPPLGCPVALHDGGRWPWRCCWPQQPGAPMPPTLRAAQDRPSRHPRPPVPAPPCPPSTVAASRRLSPFQVPAA